MAAYTYDVVVADSKIVVSDDVYGKPTEPFVESPWPDDTKVAFPLADGQTIYEIAASLLLTEKSYVVYANRSSKSFTVNYGSDPNQLLSADIASTDLAALVYVFGADLPSGLMAGKPYWAINVVDGVSFELEAVQGSGTPVDLGDSGSGSLSYNISTARSSADERLGTISALESAAQVGEGSGDLLADIAADLVLLTAKVNRLRNSGGRFSSS